MRVRCQDPTHKSYADYGGRGITVCPEWSSFERFYEDMGSRPSGASIDRIDNNKGYSPVNCRWATATVQGNNRRPARWHRSQKLTPDVVVEMRVAYEAGTVSLKELSDLHGVTVDTVRNAVTRRSWKHVA